MSIRIIIADDEALMRSGLRLILGAAEDIDIIAEATTGDEAVELTRELAPDLVLMDIRMPGMDGLEATQTIIAARPPAGSAPVTEYMPTESVPKPQILVLTAFGTDEFVFRALQSGAAGYILKDTPPHDLIQAVRTAAMGTKTLSASAVNSLLGQVASGPETTRPEATGSESPSTSVDRPDPLESLTLREREIAEAVARGLTNAEVAAHLYVSVPTVKTHLARAFDKLGVRSRVQLALLVNGSTDPE